MVNLARLIGPSFAGILIALVGEGGCFTIDAVSYLAVIATLLMMSIPAQPPRTVAQKHVMHELREGFQYAAGSRAIVSVLGLMALVSFMGMPYMTLLPMIVTRQLGGDARVLGYLTAAAGLGALGGALFLASRKTALGLGAITAASAFTFGAGLILFGLSHNFWFSLPMMFLAGLGMMVQMASSNTILQTIVEEDKRGRIMSLYAMAYTGMAPFGSLFGGVLADHIGASVTLAWGGAVCCVGALVFVRTQYGRDDLVSDALRNFDTTGAAAAGRGRAR
jgi:MFS family permease